MRATAHVRKSWFASTLLVILAVLVTSAALVAPAAAQLVDPAWDSSPLGPVGNFGLVVGPPFSAGFWGAEDADVVSALCPGPLSPGNFLRLNLGGGSYSQAWQAVDVSTGTPATISFSAWFNTCGVGGAAVGVAIRTFNSANGWPAHTLYVSNQILLDGNVQSWERVALECVSIPADTKWIVAEVFQANATAIQPSAVDNAELLFDPHCPVPTKSSTWGSVKALYR